MWAKEAIEFGVKMTDLATDYFKRLSAISLILFVGLLVNESSAAG